MSGVLRSAQRAFDAIPFYRGLYGDRPTRDDQVPFISHVTFHRAAGPIDVIASSAEIMGAVPCLRRGLCRLPLTILESEKEWRTRIARLRHAMRSLGCPVDGRLRFAVLSDDATGPFASELSNCLAWDRSECSVVFAFGSLASVRSMLAAISPDVIVVTTASLPLEELRGLGKKLVAIEHIDAMPRPPLRVDRLLVCDELWIIAAARAGEDAYRFNRRTLLVEVEPQGGRLVVTTPGFTLFALVRYCLGGGFAVVGPGQIGNV
ncbi:MAG TPA: hypothetical protein VGX71_16375 [Pseudaminobacter sp.]|nr:hypothetical protein [Pseudaminobacter sp.]